MTDVQSCSCTDGPAISYFLPNVFGTKLRISLEIHYFDFQQFVFSDKGLGELFQSEFGLKTVSVMTDDPLCN